MRKLAAVPLLLLAIASAEAAPQRVVSFNICADQLVLGLADSSQIAALSPYAKDPLISVVAEQARRFRALDWSAEGTIALRPDLVMVGPDDRPETRHMLTAHGVPVVEVGLVTGMDAARKQIRDVAALLGHAERGEAMVRALDQASARLARVAGGNSRTALAVERGGYVEGSESLAATLLAQAGLHPPVGAPSGFGGFVSLEKLLLLRPDILVIEDPPALAQDQGALFFMNPAVAALYPPQQRLSLPSKYTLCGGPALIEALDYLANVLSPEPAPFENRPLPGSEIWGRRG
ncbi:MAG TPA: ABC transporter substrate-binding protein [Xanthobacteraceae bacterium]|nr:ABC transporter substrate-binding protein [Xanthobacteraceae bacterium]